MNSIGVIGYKRGMTTRYSTTGGQAVTIIEVLPNQISQIKTQDSDGYSSVQVTTGPKRQKRVTKPVLGHCAKAGVTPGLHTREFRVNPAELDQFKAGGEVTLDVFKVGQLIDVCGSTRGKGFAGTVKRWHFATQDATHGNSLSHRAPGSIGQRQSPGKVFKGKKMSGQMGNVLRTVQQLEIVEIDLERRLLVVKGAVPGATGAMLMVTPTVKTKTAKTKTN